MFKFVNDLLNPSHQYSNYKQLSQDQRSKILEEIEDDPTETREMYFTIPGLGTYHLELLIWRHGSAPKEIRETQVILRTAMKDKVLFVSEKYGSKFHIKLVNQGPDKIAFVIAWEDPEVHKIKT